MNEMDESQTEEKPRIAHKTAPIRGLILTSLVLMILVFTKNPGEGGPQLILAFLFIVFAFLVCIFSLLLQLVWLLVSKKRTHTWLQLLYGSIVLASGGVFLIGLQTLGQLNLIDVILIAVFELVLIFYILRRL